MEFEIKENIKIDASDFYNFENNKMINKNGINNFEELNIEKIKENSILIQYLNKLLTENNLKKEEYDIYFLRNKEWYHKFIFYRK
jgi:hypothetical protein